MVCQQKKNVQITSPKTKIPLMSPPTPKLIPSSLIETYAKPMIYLSIFSPLHYGIYVDRMMEFLIMLYSIIWLQHGHVYVVRSCLCLEINY